jgi:tetratricopeptide (TPR) repeat protein
MVDRLGKVDLQRRIVGVGARRSSNPPPPPGDLAELEDRALYHRSQAQSAEGQSDHPEAAFNFSRAARCYLEMGETHESLLNEIRERTASEEAFSAQRNLAATFYQRSIDCRERSIEFFKKSGLRLEEARDRAFLGKTLSRLGRLFRNPAAYSRAVFERTQALEMFRSLRRVDLEANELSYLADDFRSLARLEEDENPLKRELYLKACGYAEEACRLFPRFLNGWERKERTLHEKNFIAEARTRAALLSKDLAEAERVREEDLALANELQAACLRGKGSRVYSLAARLQRYIAEELKQDRGELLRAVELTEKAQQMYSEEGNEWKVNNLGSHLKQLREKLAASEASP